MSNKPAPDITLNLAISAYHVLQQYCTGQPMNCKGCGFYEHCPECFQGMPCDWSLNEEGEINEVEKCDVGVPPDDIPTLQSHLRNLSESDKYNLLQVSIKYAPGIESQIYDSIVNSIGYRTMEKIRTVPATETDFYGYKRKVMAEYYHLAKLIGRL